MSQQFNYAGRPLTALSFGLVITPALAILPHIILYFFILYAAGVLVNHLVADIEDESDVDEDDVTEDEEVTPGQVR